MRQAKRWGADGAYGPPERLARGVAMLRLASAHSLREIGAARRVLEFRAFQKLFSLWHALHMPLFLMLIIAGTVHVVAVHLY